MRCAQYQGDWSSEARLWGHAASTQPDAYYAFMKLGEVRRRAGDLHGAIRAYKRLLRVDPQRKLGYAALLQVAALATSGYAGCRRSRAERYSEQFYTALDDAQALRALAAACCGRAPARAGAAARALARLRPLPDEALEHAAEAHFARRTRNLGCVLPEPDAAAHRTRRSAAAGERGAPQLIARLTAFKAAQADRGGGRARRARSASASTSRAAGASAWRVRRARLTQGAGRDGASSIARSVSPLGRCGIAGRFERNAEVRVRAARVGASATAVR